MILNGYDTTSGSRFKLKDKVAETIKQLQIMDKLELVDTRGVYAVTANNAVNFNNFVFPISMVNYAKEKITVIDQRTYFNSQGRNINIPEYNIMLLAAILQQDLQNGKTTLLKSVRPWTIKAFAGAIESALMKSVTMDVAERTALRIILGHFFVCMGESPDIDFNFVSQNAVSRALKLPASRVLETLDGIGYIGTVLDLIDVLKKRFFNFDRLDISQFMGAASSIFYSTSGFRMLVGAAVELPTLFTALCWGGATQQLYKNTLIGMELDSRRDKGVDDFIRLVEFYLVQKR